MIWQVFIFVDLVVQITYPTKTTVFFELFCKGTPRLFADDTALFYPDNNVASLIGNIESDLIVLSQYFNQNLLSLNIPKTKYMIFHSNRAVIQLHRNPKYSGQEIEKAENFKYLGILLDNSLSWLPQIKSVERKVACLCGVMWRVNKFLPRHVLLKFYYAYIHSHLNYLVSIWGRACKTFLAKIETLQNRCLKIIFNKPLLYATKELYANRSHNILPVDCLCDLQTLLFVHDILHNRNTHHNLELSTASHLRVTRQCSNLKRVRASTNLGKKRCTFIGPTKYNLLPSEIKLITNRNHFKTRLKQYLKPIAVWFTWLFSLCSAINLNKCRNV